MPFSFILVFIYSKMNDCFQFKTGGGVKVKKKTILDIKENIWWKKYTGTASSTAAVNITSITPQNAEGVEQRTQRKAVTSAGCGK